MGVIAARAGLQRVPRPHLRRPRRAVRLRRGDDRLPREPARPVGARRRRRGLAARPDDVRQGDGRRLPGRGVRRPGRRDGPPRARGPGLPGRHAVREPDRDDRRASPRSGWPTTRSTTTSPRPATSSSRRPARRSPTPACPHVVQSAGTMFSVFFTDRPVRDFAGAAAQDTARVRRVLPRDARRRRLPAALGVRGVVPVVGPRRPRGADRARRAAGRGPRRRGRR